MTDSNTYLTVLEIELLRMTWLQRILYKLGAWRFQRYRRWVGGPWRERYIEAPVHSSELDYMRWEPCGLSPLGNALGALYRSEVWPVKLPVACAIAAPVPKPPKPIVVETTVRRVCPPECRCEHCGYPWRGCVCGATPETGADPACDREPLGIQYGCRALRDRKST